MFIRRVSVGMLPERTQLIVETFLGFLLIATTTWARIIAEQMKRTEEPTGNC